METSGDILKEMTFKMRRERIVEVKVKVIAYHSKVKVKIKGILSCGRIGIRMQRWGEETHCVEQR